MFWWLKSTETVIAGRGRDYHNTVHVHIFIKTHVTNAKSMLKGCYACMQHVCMLAACMQIACKMGVKHMHACKCLHVTCKFNVHAIGPNTDMHMQVKICMQIVLLHAYNMHKLL